MADPKPIELPPSNGAEQHCVKLVVGTAREAAELCDEITPAYWQFTRQVIRVTRSGKRVTVLDVVTKIEGYDSGAKMLELRLQVAADGTTVVAVEVAAPANPDPASQPGPMERCAVPSDWEGSPIERQKGVTPYRELRRRLCSARGTYAWRGARFQRVR